jgi:membrane-associated protease RseP (regulator of RpoE activity)
VMYGLIGEKTRTIGFIVVGALVILGIVLWQGWITWAILIFLLGIGHPPPLNDITPLSSKRRVLGMLVLLLFALLFVPIPLQVIG